MSMFMEENSMIDKLNDKSLTVENFKEFVLELENKNLKNINKDDKKTMVSRIIRTYEEAKKNGN